MKKIIYFITLFFCTFLFANEPINYGWDIPNTPINIGGYFDVFYDEKSANSFLVDDVSLLLSANKNRLNFLSEVEISHLTFDGKSNGSADIRVNIERLQLGYAVSDDEEFVLGRFNSDIGYWNEAPVNILQETSTQPHMSEYVFPKATTGVMYKKNFNDEDRISLTIQHNKDIGQKDASIVVDRHLGVAYHGVNESLSWSLAGGFYREIDGVEARYFAVGAMYENEEFLLQGELLTQKSRNEKSKPYSAYLQSVWNFASKQATVLRVEGYDDEVLNTEEAIYLLGYVYRPWANMAVKGEYVYHTELPLNRFVASFSVMF